MGVSPHTQWQAQITDNDKVYNLSNINRSIMDFRWLFLLGVFFIGSSIAGCTSHQVGLEHQLLSSSIMTQKQRAIKAAEIRTQMAAQYLLNNQLDDAQLQLEKAFEAHADYAPAYDMMGLLLQREGSPINVAKAEKYFIKAIKADPDFMQSRNNYAVYLSALGRYQEAITHLKVASATLGYSGRLKALENLGLIALKIDDEPLASQAFVRILESDRNNIIAHIELVDLLLSSQRIEQAQNLHNETLLIVGQQVDRYPRIVSQGMELKRLHAIPSGAVH